MLINGILVVLLGLVLYIIGAISLLVLKGKKHKPIIWIRELFKFFFIIYGLMVVSVTLFPLLIGVNEIRDNIFLSINFIPLVDIINNVKSIGTAYGGDTLFMIKLIIKNVGGNVLLLMPLGVLAPILWRKFQHVGRMALLGMTVSISIESLQFIELISGTAYARAVDIDDVICNVLGVVIGYGIYKLMVRITNRLNYPVLNKISIEKNQKIQG